MALIEFGLQRAPRQILFGWGVVASLPRVMDQYGKRVLICTESRIVGTPVFGRLVDEARSRGCEVVVFDEVEPEVPAPSVEASARRFESFAPDLVVAIGGGSCLDHGKLLSLLLNHGGKLEDYYGELKVPGHVTPMIAVPTTSGTGSEVTPVAVVSDPGRNVKVGIASPFLIPEVALCDPELTLTCPASLTAHAGADALSHAIEAFTARRRVAVPGISTDAVFVGKNLFADHHAERAIRLIAANIEIAVSDPKNRAAREAMMLGATLAGLAFGTAGTAAAHALQYPLGADTKTPHGLGVAVLLPYVMDFNREAILGELEQIAQFLGLEPGAERPEDAAIAEVRRILERIGIPATLSGLGFEESRINWAAEQAFQAKRLVMNNPRDLDIPALAAILKHAI